MRILKSVEESALSRRRVEHGANDFQLNARPRPVTHDQATTNALKRSPSYPLQDHLYPSSQNLALKFRVKLYILYSLSPNPDAAL